MKNQDLSPSIKSYINITLARAYVHHQAGDYKKALECLNKCIEFASDVDYYKFLYLRANWQFQQGDYSKALCDFTNINDFINNSKARADYLSVNFDEFKSNFNKCLEQTLKSITPETETLAAYRMRTLEAGPPMRSKL